MPAPSADEQALLAAVIAHPDEDTPRLIYADWLDEHDQPERAEFIRAQIAVTRLSPDDPSAKALRARVVELAERHRKQWCEDGSAVFVRGFPAAVDFYTLSDFCAQGGILLARHPIRVVYATYFGNEDEAEGVVAQSPLFGRLTGLGCASRGWGGVQVATVLTNPNLTNLRMLDFNNGDYNGTEAARGIAAAKHLTNLVVLDLTGNFIQDEGLEAMAGAEHFYSLRAIRLGTDVGEAHNEIGPDGIAALARSRCFPSLAQLILDGNDIADEGLGHILGAHWAGGLTELNVADCGLSADGLIALARSRRLANLRRLDVAANDVTTAVAEAFLRSKWLPQLTDLHLYHGHEDELPSEEMQHALKARFGPGAIAGDFHAPNPLCIEDKIRWRIQHLVNEPPEPIDDCEAV
ncbi:MAG TPA: TIGR02996 domain-containing protein [Gemmata sp.]